MGGSEKSVSTTVPDCDAAECSIADDPHIKVFDGKQISLLQANGKDDEDLEDFIFFTVNDGHSSDVWLVDGETENGKSVKIQGRYTRHNADDPNSQLFVKALAIGGDFLEGNTLIIRPTQDNITWTDKTGNTRNVLTEQSSNFTVEGLVTARRHVDAYLVEDPSVVNPGVDVELPNGITLLVNRQNRYVNVVLKMKALKTQDGLCGNFNGNGEDDDLAMIEERDPRVPMGQSLFPRS